MNPRVDFFFEKAGKWQNEFEKLRTIILDCGLIEELKWGVPCYTLGKKNIVLMHGFKEYCALLFFKGALLNDPANFLVQQSENVQSARQVRFTSVKDVNNLRLSLQAYIYEAIELERSGLKVVLKKTTEYEVPDEFQKKLGKMANLRTAFANLTPGRQRAYLLHFSSARRSATREARIEKCIPQILKGKGLND